MDLQTTYLGLPLKHPLIVGASPLADDLDTVKRLEDAGAAAITLRSLFEEQITHNIAGAEAHMHSYENSFSEAASYFPETEIFSLDAESYLEKVEKVKRACDLPVIASLNGTREGDWVRYARLMEQAGADALELNLYFLATDFEETGAEQEYRCVRIVKSIEEQITIPLAVKLSPFYTALPNLARQLSGAGVNGLVLFNRFFQPDIDPEELEIEPHLELSNSSELLLRLRWVALLSERIDCDLSVSGGVHTARDVVKSIMAGATSVQMVSALLKQGPAYLATILKGLKQWMADNEYQSVDEMRGSMSYLRCPDPQALERANYMRILKSWRPGKNS